MPYIAESTPFKSSDVPGMEAHHVLHKALATDLRFTDFFAIITGEKASPGGTKLGDVDRFAGINDGTHNSILLYKDPEQAAASGTARHVSSHGVYRALNERVLLDIRDDTARLIASGVTAEDAYKQAALDVKTYQLWLKSQLLASPLAGNGDARPSVFLTNQDLMLPDGQNAESVMRSLDWETIRSRPDFQNTNFLLQFDKTGELTDARKGSAMERAVLIADAAEKAGIDVPEFSSEMRTTYDNYKLGQVTNFLTDASGGVRPYDAIVVGLAATFLVKIANDRGVELEELIDELGLLVTPETLRNAATGMAVALTEYGAIMAVAGAGGAVVKLSIDALFAAEDISSLVSLATVAFPEWEFIQDVDGTVSNLTEAFSNVADIAFELLKTTTGVEDFIIADSVGTGAATKANGTNRVEFIWGRENAALSASGGNDIVVHTGYGRADGGSGNDVLFGWTPGAGPNDERLTMDGGAGDDILISLGGVQSKLFGGAGDDTLFALTPGAELTGGTVE